jgi:hypothetical protein
LLLICVNEEPIATMKLGASFRLANFDSKKSKFDCLAAIEFASTQWESVIN